MSAPPPKGADFKRQAAGAIGAAWNLIVKGQVPAGMKQALKPCDRCQGRREIEWRGQRMPCPACCDEEGRVR